MTNKRLTRIAFTESAANLFAFISLLSSVMLPDMVLRIREVQINQEIKMNFYRITAENKGKW